MIKELHTTSPARWIMAFGEGRAGAAAAVVRCRRAGRRRRAAMDIRSRSPRNGARQVVVRA